MEGGTKELFLECRMILYIFPLTDTFLVPDEGYVLSSLPGSLGLRAGDHDAKVATQSYLESETLMRLQ